MNYAWNYAWMGLAVAVLGSGCVPDSKDGGSLVETDGNSVQSSGESTDPASSSSASQTSATTQSESSSGSSGGEVPATCVAQGWDTSYQTWQNAVAEGDGQYYYVAQSETYGGKFEVECRYSTAVRVKDGIVVERTFGLLDSLVGADCEEGFTEVGDEIGQSDVPLAAPAIGLDQLYLDCCNNQLDVPEEDFFILFEVDDAGLIEYCGAQYIGCGEGCELQEPGLVHIIDHGFGP